MMSVPVGIVDYGMGNLLSVYHALENVGANPQLCSLPEDLEQAERIVLPGVGAFRDCMASLKKTGFSEALNVHVLEKKKPIIGICLGMQAMARQSFEGGQYEGLGWFEASVVRLEPADESLRVPQVGWNQVEYRKESPLFHGLPERPDFYFVHSYHMRCEDQQDLEATCEHGCQVTASVRKGNIFGTQFHPEKSQDFGLKILENFLAWRP